MLTSLHCDLLMNPHKSHSGPCKATAYCKITMSTVADTAAASKSAWQILLFRLNMEDKHCRKLRKSYKITDPASLIEKHGTIVIDDDFPVANVAKLSVVMLYYRHAHWGPRWPWTPYTMNEFIIFYGRVRLVAQVAGAPANGLPELQDPRAIGASDYESNDEGEGEAKNGDGADA